MAKTIFHTITEIEKKKSPPLEVFFMLNKPKLFFKLCIHAGEKKKKNLYNLLVSFIVVSSLNCLPEMDQSSGNYTLK